MGARWRDSVERVRDSESLSVYTRATDNLEFIRSTMASSTSFTGVPGIGMIAMGCIALAGAYVATWEDNFDLWIACWLVVAFVGCSTGVVAMAIKARLLKVSLWHGAGRRFLLNFTPAILAGALLSEMYYNMQPAYAQGGHPYVAALWLLLYGAAVISGGAYSVRPVWVMGVCFMLAGALTYLLPDTVLSLPGTVRPYDIVLAVAFGGFHILFGAVIALRHGG
jgi:hypothetical protein